MAKSASLAGRSALVGLAVTFLAWLAVLPPVMADGLGPDADGAACRLHADVSVERQLRRLSLDLRGRMPSYEELLAVDGLSEVPSETIDAMLDEDAFRLRMRRYHEDLLWPRPVPALSNSGSGTLVRNTVTDIWYTADAAIASRFRGAAPGNSPEKNQVHCQNKPQVDLQPGYVLGDHPYCEPQPGKSYCQEGWVWLHPYWAPKTCQQDSDCDEPMDRPQDTPGSLTATGHCNAGSCEIRVCALAAQTLGAFACDHPNLDPGGDVGKVCAQNGFQGDVLNCRFRSYYNDKICGGGPNMRWFKKGALWDDVIKKDITEQALRLVDECTTGTRAYSALITAKDVHFNGRLMHWKRYFAPRLNASRPINDYTSDDGPFPGIIDWKAGWQTIERSGPHAASGVLTLPAYTLRFQTDRGRANRFRIAFEGKYFQPPDGVEEPGEAGCEESTDDLIERCTCRKCHQELEDKASHFGAYIEQGSMSARSLPESFVGTGATAEERIKAAEKLCLQTIKNELGGAEKRFCLYLYQPERDASGNKTGALVLQGLEWAERYAFIKKHFDEGPGALAAKTIANGSFHRATVMHLFAFFFGRPMDVSPGSPEQALQDELAAEFAKHDSFKQVVRRIVTLPAYRRTP